MTPDRSFSDFELAGWEDESTAAAYDRHLSLVTTQSVDALLDDAIDSTKPGVWLDATHRAHKRPAHLALGLE